MNITQIIRECSLILPPPTTKQESNENYIEKADLQFLDITVVLYIFHCIFTFMTSIYVSSSLFVLVYLTEGNSKFLQEKTKMFIFSLYAVLPVCVNDQPNAYFCINVVCIKGCCTA